MNKAEIKLLTITAVFHKFCHLNKVLWVWLTIFKLQNLKYPMKMCLFKLVASSRLHPSFKLVVSVYSNWLLLYAHDFAIVPESLEEVKNRLSI